MQSDDFFDDLKRLRMPVPERVVPGSIAATKRKRRSQQFIMFPYSWLEKLRKAHYADTFRVALFLLHRHWKNGGQSIPLSNVGLSEMGVTRWGKWRALAELERLGLVKVVRRPRKVPMVTVYGLQHAA